MRKADRQHIEDRWALAGLLVLVTLALLAQATYLPVTITGAALGLLAWRGLRTATGRGGLTGRIPRASLALACIALIVVDYGTMAGPEAGVALLSLMLALKVLETHGRRDLVVATQIGLFLAATALLFSPTTARLALAFSTACGFMALLMHVHGRPATGRGRARLMTELRRTLAIVCQAVPLMLILFYLFPRLPGPIWSLPRPAQGSGQGGLDDRMSPGAISHLSQSDAVAFRVHFDGPLPDRSRLYWRGPVLWDTDGRIWSNHDETRSTPTGIRPSIAFSGPRIAYEVTLEPYHRRWLYALELPVAPPPAARTSHDLVLIADRTIDAARRYRLVSRTEYRVTRLSPADRQRALRLPEGHAQRTRALGRRWREESASDRAVVERALAYFREQPFHYTLDPPVLERDPSDEFLFETRRGFCEHYAAAFTLLMRSAGIPARVVTGYQGGQFNDIGGYLIVRQRDAHAWSEVWLDDRGWTRVDPTAAVSPARIEQGIDEALALDAGQKDRERSGLSRLWRRARFSLDALGTAWRHWVLDFDPSQQASLFASLGITGWRVLALVLGGALLVAVLLLIVVLRRQEGVVRDPVQRVYDVFCHRLARHGLPRRPNEGPIDYAYRIGSRRPDLARDVEAITMAYARLRYAGDDPRRLVSFRRAVRGFRPRWRRMTSDTRSMTDIATTNESQTG